MGIATWHEFKPARSSSTSPLEGEVGAKRREGGAPPRKPTLDEMGPGVESIPSRPAARSTMGRPGQHGGFRANKKKR
jgi:excinuclease ABC subunit B